MFMRSPRLFLRPPFPEDGQDFAAAMTGAGLLHRVKPVDAEALPAMAVRTAPGRSVACYPRLAITLPTTAGAPLIGVGALLRRAHGTELVCGIVPDMRGRGFATEAVLALLEIASVIGHRIVIALPFGDDPAGGRVLEKAGFGFDSGTSAYRIDLGELSERVFIPAAA